MNDRLRLPLLTFSVFIVALGLRLLLLGWPPFYTGIEELHAPSSVGYTETGHFDPDNDYSNPFRKLLQYPLLKVFGNNAYARRFPNAVFGALTALFLVLVGQRLFPKSKVGLVAGILLATDPFHIAFSRTTWEDVPAALFATAGLYFFLAAADEDNSDSRALKLLLSGLLLALGFATRRYLIIVPTGLFAWLCYSELKTPSESRGTRLAHMGFYASVFLALPLVLYLFTFLPWFGRGYSLSEWLAFQAHMFSKEAAGVTPDMSFYGRYYGNSWQAIDWFTKVVAFGSQMRVSASSVTTHLVINNPLIWLLVWPSVGLGVYLWRKKIGPANLGLVIGFFILLYLPFLLVRRQVLVYSALAVLPMALLMLATIMGFASSRGPRARALVMVTVSVLIVSNIALYPLATAWVLPEQLAAYVPFQSYLFKAD